MTKKIHAQAIAAECLKRVEKQWGKDAKKRLGPTLFEALVAREALTVIIGQDSPETAGAYMNDLALEALRLASPEDYWP